MRCSARDSARESAYVTAWPLFAFQCLILWEIPFMPARFVWFRPAVSLPFPLVAAANAMAFRKPWQSFCILPSC